MFVSWNEQQSATARDKALSKARVQAYAARVAHQRRLERQSKAPSAVQDERHHPRRIKEQSPSSLVPWRGNSDPFRSQAIDITPRLGQILDFLKTVWIPAGLVTLPPPFPPTVRSFFCTQLMFDQLSSDDAPSALSVLLPCASALAVLTGSEDVGQQRTKLKLTAISQLRTQLSENMESGAVAPPIKKADRDFAEEPGSTSRTSVTNRLLSNIVPDDKILYLTQALFIASVNEGNDAEANTHGSMLQWLMRRKTDSDGYDSIAPDMLCQALGYDIVRSQMTRTFSLFDVESWVPACQRVHRLPVVDTFGDFRAKILAGLDHSIKNSPLQRVLLGTYQCFRTWAETDDPATDLEPAQIWNYVTITNATLQLQATNYSLIVQRVIHAPTFAAKLGRRAQAYWRVQACCVFSVLLWQLTNISDLKIAGQSYWPRGSMIASDLCEHIETYCTNFINAEGRYEGHYQHALLFSCWTGATWRRRHTQSPADLESCFFHRTLCRVATECGLTCSEDVKSIVDRFLPTIHMRPKDWKWLDPMLQQTHMKKSPQS